MPKEEYESWKKENKLAIILAAFVAFPSCIFLILAITLIGAKDSAIIGFSAVGILAIFVLFVFFAWLAEWIES